MLINAFGRQIYPKGAFSGNAARDLGVASITLYCLSDRKHAAFLRLV